MRRSKQGTQRESEAVIRHALASDHLWRYRGYPIAGCPEILEQVRREWQARWTAAQPRPADQDQWILDAAALELRQSAASAKQASLPVLIRTAFEPTWEIVEDRILGAEQNAIYAIHEAHPVLLRRAIALIRKERVWERNWSATKLLLAAFGINGPNKGDPSIAPLFARLADVLDGAEPGGFLSVAAKGRGLQAALPIAAANVQHPDSAIAAASVRLLAELELPQTWPALDAAIDHPNLAVALWAGSAFYRGTPSPPPLFERLSLRLCQIPLDGVLPGARGDWNWPHIAEYAKMACVAQLQPRPLEALAPVAERWPYLVLNLEERIDQDLSEGIATAGLWHLLFLAFSGESTYHRRWAFSRMQKLPLGVADRRAVEALRTRTRSPELRKMCSALLA